MKNHKFIYAGKYNDRKVYLVICEKTGGDFHTEIWNRGKFKKNKCPCCNETIG